MLERRRRAAKSARTSIGMHARGSVVLSNPQSFKLDVADGFHNHWHVKSVFLKDIPTTGVRIYNYYDDGVRNTVGGLDCTRYIVLSDPQSGEPLAIVDEHWSYAIRSAAAAVHRLQVGGPERPEGARPRRHRHHGHEFAALPRHHVQVRGDPLHLAPAARRGAAFARQMVAGARHPGRRRRTRSRRSCAAPTSRSAAPPRARSSAASHGSSPAATFISLARRELDPAGWSKMDKVVIDSWEFNMLQREFRRMVEAGLFSRDAAARRDPRAGRRRRSSAASATTSAS